MIKGTELPIHLIDDDKTKPKDLVKHLNECFRFIEKSEICYQPVGSKENPILIPYEAYKLIGKPKMDRNRVCYYKGVYLLIRHKRVRITING